jgi:phosphate uptake regulator
MTDKHLSTQFDAELSGISTRVLEMGGLVESQIRTAVYALAQFSAEAATQVIEAESRVNAMEVEIDRELSSIIARRQPTARDLRLLIAISKTTANLERAGDEAEKIARMVQSILNGGGARNLPASELRTEADLASGLLRKALDAFARLRAQAHHLHDGRPAHHHRQPGPAVRGQGHRAHRRPCQEHRRVHRLCGQGRGHPPLLDGRHRVGAEVTGPS